MLIDLLSAHVANLRAHLPEAEAPEPEVLGRVSLTL